MKTWGFLGAAMGLLIYSLVVLVLVPSHLLEQGAAPLTMDPNVMLGRRQYVAQGCVYCHSQQPRDPSLSRADSSWGWGPPSKPQDYQGDDPHLLGTMRTGPDLFNIGQRQPSRDWHLVHLYQPRLVVPSSIMPAFPFLFREVAEAKVGETVVHLPPGQSRTGIVVVALPEATHLVDYLLSLHPKGERNE